MSAEIAIVYPSGSDLYATIRNQAREVWYIVGAVFETWGTSGRDADDYDIPLTDDNGDYYVGDFIAGISSGQYSVAVYSQVGASASDTDSPVGAGEIWWSGSAEQTQTEYELNSYDPPTKTEMDDAFTEIKGATWDAGTDTLEDIRDDISNRVEMNVDHEVVKVSDS